MDAAVALVVGADAAVTSDLQPLDPLYADGMEQFPLLKNRSSRRVLEQQDQMGEAGVAVVEDSSRIPLSLAKAKPQDAPATIQKVALAVRDRPMPEIMLRGAELVISDFRESERGLTRESSRRCRLLCRESASFARLAHCRNRPERPKAVLV